VKPKTFAVEIFLVCLAAILLEISYTRIFSFKVFYYFTYLTIGIALLGIGSGGIFVATSARLRAIEPVRLIAGAATGASLIIPFSYLIVAKTQLNALDAADSAFEAAKLAFACGVLFAPFLLVGVIISTTFGTRPAEISRLYFADLCGAGLGCMVCIPLFNLIAPPGTVILSGVVMALAGFIAARGISRPIAGVAATAISVLAITTVASDLLPDPVTDRVKTMSPQRQAGGAGWGGRPLYSEWSSVFRVDVAEGDDPEVQHLINHDGNLGSTILRFDGDLSKMSRFERDVRATPFSILPPNPEVLIIGAAGGHEIVVSLYFGAAHVTAVELNPVTVSLLTDHFADYSGRLAENERVTLVNGEGRSFIKRDRRKYDLIWFVAPDSYAAMNAASSGAFVLSESYLYTREMIKESLGRLKDGGVICLQTGDVNFARKPNRASRYLATARAAFRELGAADFSKHILVSSTPELFTVATILLGKDPFTADQVRGFHETSGRVGPHSGATTIWHPLAAGEEPDLSSPLVKTIFLEDGALRSWQRQHPYDLTAVEDNSPFFWHFVRFRDVFGKRLDADDLIVDPEDSKGERVLLLLLGVAVVFSAVFLLLPLTALRGVWSRIPYKLNSGIYFGALGLGFMFFEIVLIQKLTLFLGYPSYSLTVTLFAILIFSGLGSLLSGGYAEKRRVALPLLLVALAGMAGFFQFGMPWVVGGFIGSPLAVRIGITIGLLAPLGLCLGAFMPIGLGTIARMTTHQEEYVAWAWAVNGFFSVTSTTLATILSMAFGFEFVLATAVAIYALGIAALSRIPVGVNAQGGR
jgi:hypothetical protein